MGETIEKKISIENLTFEFSKKGLNKKRARIIIEKLEFKPGSYSMITGNNGTGKSSLINVMIFNDVFEKTFWNRLIFGNSYIKPKTGDVIYFSEEHKEGFGLYQTADFEKCTNVVRQFVSYYLGSRKELDEIQSVRQKGKELHLEGKTFIDKERLLNRISTIYKHFDYEAISHLSLNQMSEGQLSLTFLINKLIDEKFLYIFDEPLNGLDKTKASLFNQYLNDIVNKEKKSVLIISHCFNNLEPHLDKVYSINATNEISSNTEVFKLEQVKDYHSDVKCFCINKKKK